MAHWHVEMKSMLDEDKKEWSEKIIVGMILFDNSSVFPRFR